MKKDRFAVTFGIYCQAVQPLIDWCAEHPGAKTQIRIAMERQAGRSIRKENITRWMAADVVKRVEPSYGSGVLLLRIGATLMSTS